jgi:hypothetical protein
LSTSPRHVNAAADLGLLISHHVRQYHASARALLPAVAGPTYQPPPPQLCTARTSPPTHLCLGWVVVTARSRSCHAANPIPDPPPPILSCRYGELDTPHLSLSHCQGLVSRVSRAIDYCPKNMDTTCFSPTVNDRGTKYPVSDMDPPSRAGREGPPT